MSLKHFYKNIYFTLSFVHPPLNRCANFNLNDFTSWITSVIEVLHRIQSFLFWFSVKWVSYLWSTDTSTNHTKFAGPQSSTEVLKMFVTLFLVLSSKKNPPKSLVLGIPKSWCATRALGLELWDWSQKQDEKWANASHSFVENQTKLRLSTPEIYKMLHSAIRTMRNKRNTDNMWDEHTKKKRTQVRQNDESISDCVGICTFKACAFYAFHGLIRFFLLAFPSFHFLRIFCFYFWGE